MGLIFDGRLVEFEHGDRIIDGSRVGAWWGRDEFGTGPRVGDIDLACVHWTAGEAGALDPDGPGPLTSFDDDGPRVVRGMKARESKNRPGQKLQVSIQFVVGACAPDALFAKIWQTMDLAHNTAVHVGDRQVNRRSIGMEVVSCGVPGAMDLYHRPTQQVNVAGQRITISQFYRGQINSITWLLEVLTSHDAQTHLGEALRSARILIPRQVPMRKGLVLSDRFTPKQQRKWKGVQEHLNVPGSTKIDAGTQSLTALRSAGFMPVGV